MNTLVLKVEYDGTNYSGWQRQNNSNSIQEELEKALFLLFNKNYNVIGAGRTDRGVHALGQICSVKNFDYTNIPIDKIKIALNSKLNNDIRVMGSCLINASFNARFDATAREYIYNITTNDVALYRNYVAYIKYPIDFDLLQASAKIFIGEFNFTTYSKKNLDTKNYICNVELSEWIKIQDDFLQYKIKANRFVYGMVRSLVGAMLDVSRKKITLEEFNKQLLLNDRNYNSPLAPAKGLILNKIYYNDEIIFY